MASSRGVDAVRLAEIERMTVEQLKVVKEQTDVEVNLLPDSLNSIRTATARLEVASSALDDLLLRPQGEKKAGKVLVDVGTGFFIERSSASICFNLGPGTTSFYQQMQSSFSFGGSRPQIASI